MQPDRRYADRAVFFSPATPTEAQSAVSSPRAILTDVANGIHGTTAQHRSTANCEEPTRRNALPPAIWETRYLNSTEAYAVVLASDLILKKRSDMGWRRAVDFFMLSLLMRSVVEDARSAVPGTAPWRSPTAHAGCGARRSS
ncbi:unnamed protein product [Durusdinium trenchii]|uniref:Uncharacterized protein n=1 Tax=Durusdinium trenchii TaxID=1381693 RepID=A0ABP0MFW1_9DINO